MITRISIYLTLLFLLLKSLTQQAVATNSPTASPSTVRSSQNNIYSIAGNGGPTTGGSGMATALSLGQPRSVWEDNQGVVYVMEYSGHCVRKFSYATGIAANFIGQCTLTGAIGGDGYAATSGQMNHPSAIGADINGNFYVADRDNNRIRVVSSQVINTLAGCTSCLTNNGDGGPATSSTAYNPSGLWVDSIGQVYFTTAGTSAYVTRKIGINGGRQITLVAGIGAGGSSAGDGGPATSATLWTPKGVFVDTLGVVYIGDTNNNKIRTVSLSGYISTAFGSGTASYNGENLPASATNLNNPIGVVVDTSNGDIYTAANSGYRLSVLTMSTGLSSTYAGNGGPAYSGDGGPATAAQIQPYGLYLDTTGKLFAADSSSYRVYVIYSVTPTDSPTQIPTAVPTTPTVIPTICPSLLPSVVPSIKPSVFPTVAPTLTPTALPTVSPSVFPSVNPTMKPSVIPTGQPSITPSIQPSIDPTASPSVTPTLSPSIVPSTQPSVVPSVIPSALPTVAPTVCPTLSPSKSPSVAPSIPPSCSPTVTPTAAPSTVPSIGPSVSPSTSPTLSPSGAPTVAPTITPTVTPTLSPTVMPSNLPTVPPTAVPSIMPSVAPSLTPSVVPSLVPTVAPTVAPSTSPSVGPSVFPSIIPTQVPSTLPTIAPSRSPSVVPSVAPSVVPTANPSLSPSSNPSILPSLYPTISPSLTPTMSPSAVPSVVPTVSPSGVPSVSPSVVPSIVPTVAPTVAPSTSPSVGPSVFPSIAPTQVPSTSPTIAPSRSPSVTPSVAPSVVPTANPSLSPSSNPSMLPSLYPTISPSLTPTMSPSAVPSVVPTFSPSGVPSVMPTVVPSAGPTTSPSSGPSAVPTVAPTVSACGAPSMKPSVVPSADASTAPSVGPSIIPTSSSTILPSDVPSVKPSVAPSVNPSTAPSLGPAVAPSVAPTVSPSAFQSCSPTRSPSVSPTEAPTVIYTVGPSPTPSLSPTFTSSSAPSVILSAAPSNLPSAQLITSQCPTVDPSRLPTCQPSPPTFAPTLNPTLISSTASTSPSVASSMVPSATSSTAPSEEPSNSPSVLPSVHPSPESPTILPSEFLSSGPSASPSVCMTPTNQPTSLSNTAPTITSVPTVEPSGGMVSTVQPSALPSSGPSVVPSSGSTARPSVSPSGTVTVQPSAAFSLSPSTGPTEGTHSPVSTVSPSMQPSSESPTLGPSVVPTSLPSVVSEVPSVAPSTAPTLLPSPEPTTITPTLCPSQIPSQAPSVVLTANPSTRTPSAVPSLSPTAAPSSAPTTVEFFDSHPKSTLPFTVGTTSISVHGTSSSSSSLPASSFKIVLPFSSMSGDISSVSAFSDIWLSQGTDGKSYAFSDSVTQSPSSLSNANAYINTIGLDSSKRSVSVVSDVNGDGRVDLIIGDPYGSKCYVMFGTPSGLVNMTSGFTIFGEGVSDLTGWSVSDAGDVNNDTLSDIIIGAPFVNGIGAFYVVYGRHRNNWDVYLNNLTSSEGFAVYGARRGDYLGISVSAAGDVNKDGFDDVIAGAVVTSSASSGAAYVVFGGQSLAPDFLVSSLSSTNGFKLTGSSYSYVGCSVSGVGDVNKDGRADFLIGSSPQRTGTSAAAYLVFGSSAVTESLASLTAQQGVRITGAGEIVSTTGDGDVFISTALPDSGSLGFIVYTNVSLLTTLTSDPSVTPTLSPLATRVPTARPSFKPSVNPTRRPTAPTVTPTVGASVPSASPSAAPTQPTLTPSESPTESPTAEPSSAPTRRPSMQPSTGPSASPTVASTAAPFSAIPTLPSLTRAPFALPTLRPTVMTSLPRITTYVISEGANLTSTSSHINYILNTTEAVSIDNTGGLNRYTVLPKRNASLSIASFNLSSDLIDLSAFVGISQFSQLVLTEGSVYVHLPNHQLIHILHLKPALMSAENFIFWRAPEVPKPDRSIKTLSILAGSLIAFGGLVAVLWFSHMGYTWLRTKSLAEVKKVFLMTITEVDGVVVARKPSEDSVEASTQSPQSRKGVWMFLHQYDSDEELLQRSINSEGEWYYRGDDDDSADDSADDTADDYADGDDDDCYDHEAYAGSEDGDASNHESVNSSQILSDYSLDSEGQFVWRM